MDNIAEAQLAHRVRTAFGDVHAMPFADGYADLVVSRGSMFFWKDLRAAFGEILRALAPGSATYIGGGFGNLELEEQVIAEMRKRDPEWNCYAKKKTGEDAYRIVDDDSGFWVVVTKP